MPGITVFGSLAEAIRLGYQIETTIPNGYVVRCRTASGWVRAVVDLKK